MTQPSQFRLWCLAALLVATVAASSSTQACEADLRRQCACARLTLDHIVGEALSSVNGTPARRHDVTVTTQYFILGTVTDTSLRVGEDRYRPGFPGVHRFRVDASWAPLPASREIGRTISLYARHEFCVPARYRLGQQYLLRVGFAGDTLVNLIGCGGVFPSDSGTTRAAIALLDSALSRR